MACRCQNIALHTLQYNYLPPATVFLCLQSDDAGASMSPCAPLFMACQLAILLTLWLCRFVDPSDPSKLYLAQPTEPAASDRPSAPKYASNYGIDETYEAM